MSQQGMADAEAGWAEVRRRLALMKSAAGAVPDSRLPNQEQRQGAVGPDIPPDQIDKEAAGSDYGLRAQVGLKASDAGRYNFLTKSLGKDNVKYSTDKDGNLIDFYVRRGDKWHSLNKPGLDVGDIAEAAGQAPRVVPGIAGSVAGAMAGGPGGAAVGGAIGDAAGEALAQGISAAMPGSDELTAGDRLKMGAINVGAGLLGEGIAAGGRMAKGAVSKGVGRAMLGKAEKGAVSEGLELEARTGVQFDPAQLTQTPKARLLGQKLRQQTGTMDKLFNADVGRAKQLQEFVGKSLDAALGNSGIGAEDAGKRAAAVATGAIKQIAERGRQEAAAGFAEAARLTAGKPVADPGNYMAALEKRLAEIADRSTPAMDREAAQIERMIDAARQPLTVTALQNRLREFGKAAAGDGRIFNDIESEADRRFAKMALAGLRADLDSLADSGAAGAALKAARDRTASMYRELDDVQKTMVEKMFGLQDKQQLGKLPAQIFGGGLSDENVRTGMAFLRKTDPDAARGLARAAIEDGLASKAAATGQAAERGVELSPSKFAAWATKSRARMSELVADDKLMGVFDDAVKTARRIGDISGGQAGSQTARMLWSETLPGLAAVMAIGGGAGLAADNAGAGIAMAGATVAARLAERRYFAKAFTDREARDIILGLAQPTRGKTAEAVKLVTKLAAILERDDYGPKIEAAGGGGSVLSPAQDSQPMEIRK